MFGLITGRAIPPKKPWNVDKKCAAPLYSLSLRKSSVWVRFWGEGRGESFYHVFQCFNNVVILFSNLCSTSDVKSTLGVGGMRPVFHFYSLIGEVLLSSLIKAI